MRVNKICYISDFLLADLIGGGELNDYELCEELIKKGYKLSKIRSHEVRVGDLRTNIFYIISNFINLRKNTKEQIQRNCNYVVYEHDHKYLISRDPALYKNYIAPKEHVINKEFYKKAKSVFCQSSFHESIVKKNIGLTNTYNVSGNLWSKDSLEIMRALSHTKKIDCFSILDSGIKHKNTMEAIFYCDKKGYEYSLISSDDYHEFLSLLSKNDKFIFLPKTPETLSRIVVEARMMSIKTLTNKRVGAAHEPWFHLEGEVLINYMTNKKIETVNKIIEVMNG